MIEAKSKAIGQYTFTVEQFGYREGSRLLVEILALLGKPLGEALGSGAGLESVNVGKLIEALAKALDPSTFERVRDAFLVKSTVSGGPFGDKAPRLSDVADAVFAGHYELMLGWLTFCLEANYADFFGAMRSVVK